MLVCRTSVFNYILFCFFKRSKTIKNQNSFSPFEIQSAYIVIDLPLLYITYTQIH